MDIEAQNFKIKSGRVDLHKNINKSRSRNANTIETHTEEEECNCKITAKRTPKSKNNSIVTVAAGDIEQSLDIMIAKVNASPELY